MNLILLLASTNYVKLVVFTLQRASVVSCIISESEKCNEVYVLNYISFDPTVMKIPVDSALSSA